MINVVEITNFQAHRSSVIEFAPGMNIITGSSDAGKSAIIRALLWAITNRPSGGDFKSWDAGEKEQVEVAIEFTDGSWIAKHRIKEKNTYTCEEGEYTALRTDVPDVIQEICNITDYNIQTQARPYFMLPDTPGDRAKKLNDLVGLSIIDTLLKRINSKVASSKDEIKRLSASITKVTKEIEDLSYIDSVAPQIEKLQSDIDKHLVNSQSLDLMRSLRDKLSEIQRIKADASKILKYEAAYNSLITQIQNHTSLEKETELFKNLCVQWRNIREHKEEFKYLMEMDEPVRTLTVKVNSYQIEETTLVEMKATCKTLKELEQKLSDELEWLSVEKPYNALQSRIKDHVDQSSILCDLKKRFTNLDRLDLDLDNEKIGLSNSIKEYTGLLEQVGVCPICESKISHKTINQIKLSLEE